MKEVWKDMGGGKFTSSIGTAKPKLETIEVKQSLHTIDHTLHKIFDMARVKFAFLETFLQPLN